MKNLVLMTAILFSLAACKKTVTQTINRSIIGKWKLSESLADPGDGSGTWHPVDPSNTNYLEFKKDGTVNVSPYFANSWDHYQLTSDSTIIFFSGSQQFIRGYHFSITLLTISGGCIEACGGRYIPVQ